jgi:hypothetical protein
MYIRPIPLRRRRVRLYRSQEPWLLFYSVRRRREASGLVRWLIIAMTQQLIHPPPSQRKILVSLTVLGNFK